MCVWRLSCILCMCLEKISCNGMSVHLADCSRSCVSLQYDMQINIYVCVCDVLSLSTARIRGLYSTTARRWLRDDQGKSPPAGRWPGARTLSADSFLRRVEKTRDRVTRAVRMREAERRQKREQRENSENHIFQYSVSSHPLSVCVCV